MVRQITSCVIPAAGLGTRFLPATRALPKELLPVGDKPAIQWGVEEAVAAGASRMVIILSRGKELISRHFGPAPELEAVLTERGKQRELDIVRAVEHLAEFRYAYQEKPLGLGHAVLCAKEEVGEEPFFGLLPDDLCYGSLPILQQLGTAYQEFGTTILALMRVPKSVISRYGAARIVETRGRYHRIDAVIEKPQEGEAPSDLAIMGRYVLMPGMFDILSSVPPGAGGEIQLTDGIQQVIQNGGTVWGVEFEGELLDVGTINGWYKALHRVDPTTASR